MIKLLIADDHSGIRLSMSKFLNHQPGMKVVGMAENGIQALQMVEQYAPDILLLDINMPDMNGIEVVRTLKRRKVNVRIIVFSMMFDNKTIRTMLDLGVLGYIAKEDGSNYLPEAILKVYQDGSLYLSPAIPEKIRDRAIARQEKLLGDTQRKNSSP